AVQAALDFGGRLLRRKTELDFGLQIRETLRELRVLHLAARGGIVVVAVAPRMHPDLGAHEIHAVLRTLGERNSLAVIVNGDRRLMSMLYRPDDVLRPPRRVAAEEHPGTR